MHGLAGSRIKVLNFCDSVRERRVWIRRECGSDFLKRTQEPAEIRGEPVKSGLKQEHLESRFIQTRLVEFETLEPSFEFTCTFKPQIITNKISAEIIVSLHQSWDVSAFGTREKELKQHLFKGFCVANKLYKQNTIKLSMYRKMVLHLHKYS